MKLWLLAALTVATGSAACAKGEKPQGGAAVAERTGLAPEGSLAPLFDATAHTGERVSLSALRGKPVVLYFYPRDDTSGCTKEACEIRDAWQKIKDTGAVVLGVSTDDNASHVAFANKYQLPFLL